MRFRDGTRAAGTGDKIMGTCWTRGWGRYQWGSVVAGCYRGGMLGRVNGRRLPFGIAMVVVLLVGLVSGARAGESTRLAYVRGQGAERCPDEKALRLAVLDRLGYDPFVAWAPKTVHAEVARDGPKLRARVYLADSDGRARGSRELSAPADECDKLLAAAALAISIAIDPMGAGASPPTTSVASMENETSPEVARDRRSMASNAPPLAVERPSMALARPEAVPGEQYDHSLRRDTSARWFGGLGTMVTSGSSPGPAAAIAVFVRLGWDVGSLAIEGRYHLPASEESSTRRGGVEARLYLVSLEPCLKFSPWSVCGLATVGSLEGTGEKIGLPLQQSTLYWGLGGRAALELVIIDPLFMRAHVDLVGNATRTTLAIDGAEIWRAPALAAAAGIDVVARIW
jgi:hypothetical protein